MNHKRVCFLQPFHLSLSKRLTGLQVSNTVQDQMMCPTKGREIETKRNKSVATKSGPNKTSGLSSKSSAVFSRLIHVSFVWSLMKFTFQN